MLDGHDNDEYLQPVDFSGLKIGQGGSAPILAESLARQRLERQRVREAKAIAASTAAAAPVARKQV